MSDTEIILLLLFVFFFLAGLVSLLQAKRAYGIQAKREKRTALFMWLLAFGLAVVVIAGRLLP